MTRQRGLEILLLMVEIDTNAESVVVCLGLNFINLFFLFNKIQLIRMLYWKGRKINHLKLQQRVLVH